MAAVTGGAVGAGLILCCLLTQHVLGALPAPRNVSLTSKNFSIFLTWVPEEHTPENYYVVEIKSYNVWQPFTNCTNPLGEGCDVTCSIRSCYQYYQAKVGSNVPGHPISWSFSRYFYPLNELELGAPQLKVNVTEESVLVHLQIKLAACKEEVLKACLIDNLSYEVEFWNTDERVLIRQSSNENIIKINKSQLQGINSCVSARSVYKNTNKLSNFSEPVCFELKAKRFHTAVIFTILACLLGSLLAIFILITITVAKVKQTISVPSKLKIPGALDFTRTTAFNQVTDYHSVECSLANVIDCNESKEILEEKTAFERTVKQEETETNASNDVDDLSESDEEIECSDYTENRWIPEGMVFDNDEPLDDDICQTANTEPYQKADDSFMSSHIAADIQSQVSDSSNHDTLQTDEDWSSSVTSEVLNSQNFCDSISLLQQCNKHSSCDIPLTSVQLLIENEEYDDMLPSVHNQDMNFVSSPSHFRRV